MDRPLWFKAKRYGWGWYPVTWQGWLATLAYAFLVIAFATSVDEDAKPIEVFFMLVFPLGLLTAALIRIAYATGEKPRWRWGGK